ncbi:MAG: Na/Pi cotransporter family protein [Candidatus Gastranaerophilaceae bacterium]|nr:Na/Pi cotransporter family protein [Christensenellales bacterium]
MDIFDVFMLLGGLVLFLYGMNVMGGGLEKLSGSKLERILENLTNNPLKGVLVGAGVTAIIQSSSATTVMVVGFVNSGIMKLKQAIGIIMGANIGTTVTAWILSLTGIQGDSIWISMLKPTSFAPILAVIGMGVIMFSKSGRKRDLGSILVGFFMLMFGMSAMSDAVAPLANSEAFTSILLLFTNPLFGVLAGTVLTAIIQSSSASVGILQALATTGSITYGMAIPIIMGQNIGTCATALISCIGANKNAKRAAMIHFYFNIIGTIIFLALFYVLDAIIGFSFTATSINGAEIAMIHTVFNLTSTAIMLPFGNQLAKLATLTIREGSKEEVLLDERLLNVPSFAIEQCKNVIVEMAALARNTLNMSLAMIDKYDAKTAKLIIENEDKIDRYEDVLGTYLVKLSARELSEEDSNEVSKLLHIIGDLERIGDHCVNIVESVQEMANKGIAFSNIAKGELGVMGSAVSEIVGFATDIVATEDLKLASKVEPLEEVIDGLETELKMRHVRRLKDGNCTIELGFIFSDLITNYERVADHCSNIAACVIQISVASFDMHEYLSVVKSETPFAEQYQVFKDKYTIN